MPWAPDQLMASGPGIAARRARIGGLHTKFRLAAQQLIEPEF